MVLPTTELRGKTLVIRSGRRVTRVTYDRFGHLCVVHSHLGLLAKTAHVEESVETPMASIDRSEPVGPFVQTPDVGHHVERVTEETKVVSIVANSTLPLGQIETGLEFGGGKVLVGFARVGEKEDTCGSGYSG